MNGFYAYPGFYPPDFARRLMDEKQDLKRQSIRAGVCVIAFICVRQIISLVVSFVPALRNLYLGSPEIADMIDMALYIACTFVPFLVAYSKMSDRDKRETDLYKKPISKTAAVLAVIAGLMFCMVGNLVTSVLTSLYDSAGISSDGGTYEAATEISGILMQVVTIAILPALIEEFALRSVVMQPLRRFGDKFAILMSALVFALMHSDLLQSPFAFIAGAAMGYFTIATGSIWVSVAIHFCNNLYSVILTYLLEVRPTLAQTVANISMAVLIVGGVICLACFLTVVKHNKLQNPQCVTTASEKTKMYLGTAPMIICIVLLVIETFAHVRISGFMNG